MGCTQSKAIPSTPTPTSKNSSFEQSANQKANPLTAQQIQARSDCPLDCKYLEVGDLRLRYAWVSQRGYYPDSKFHTIRRLPMAWFLLPILLGPDKDNQDSYSIIPVFGNPDDNQAYFAVYDGHGKDGHLCARYTRDYVSHLISFLSIHLFMMRNY